MNRALAPLIPFDLLDEAERRVLVARFPDAQIEYADADGVSAAATTADPQEQALLRALVSGGRLEIAVECDLSILQANTTHRSGQRVTLLGVWQFDDTPEIARAVPISA